MPKAKEPKPRPKRQVDPEEQARRKMWACGHYKEAWDALQALEAPPGGVIHGGLKDAFLYGPRLRAAREALADADKDLRPFVKHPPFPVYKGFIYVVNPTTDRIEPIAVEQLDPEYEHLCYGHGATPEETQFNAAWAKLFADVDEKFNACPAEYRRRLLDDLGSLCRSLAHWLDNPDNPQPRPPQPVSVTHSIEEQMAIARESFAEVSAKYLGAPLEWPRRQLEQVGQEEE